MKAKPQPMDDTLWQSHGPFADERDLKDTPNDLLYSLPDYGLNSNQWLSISSNPIHLLPTASSERPSPITSMLPTNSGSGVAKPPENFTGLGVRIALDDVADVDMLDEGISLEEEILTEHEELEPQTEQHLELSRNSKNQALVDKRKVTEREMIGKHDNSGSDLEDDEYDCNTAQLDSRITIMSSSKEEDDDHILKIGDLNETCPVWRHIGEERLPTYVKRFLDGHVEFPSDINDTMSKTRAHLVQLHDDLVDDYMSLRRLMVDLLAQSMNNEGQIPRWALKMVASNMEKTRLSDSEVEAIQKDLKTACKLVKREPRKKRQTPRAKKENSLVTAAANLLWGGVGNFKEEPGTVEVEQPATRTEEKQSGGGGWWPFSPKAPEQELKLEGPPEEHMSETGTEELEFLAEHKTEFKQWKDNRRNGRQPDSGKRSPRSSGGGRGHSLVDRSSLSATKSSDEQEFNSPTRQDKKHTIYGNDEADRARTDDFENLPLVSNLELAKGLVQKILVTRIDLYLSDALPNLTTPMAAENISNANIEVMRLNEGPIKTAYMEKVSFYEGRMHVVHKRLEEAKTCLERARELGVGNHEFSKIRSEDVENWLSHIQGLIDQNAHKG